MLASGKQWNAGFSDCGRRALLVQSWEVTWGALLRGVVSLRVTNRITALLSAESPSCFTVILFVTHLVLTFFFFLKSTRRDVSVRIHSIDSSSVRPRNTRAAAASPCVTWPHHALRLLHQGEPPQISLLTGFFLTSVLHSSSSATTDPTASGFSAPHLPSPIRLWPCSPSSKVLLPFLSGYFSHVTSSVVSDTPSCYWYTVEQSFVVHSPTTLSQGAALQKSEVVGTTNLSLRSWQKAVPVPAALWAYGTNRSRRRHHCCRYPLPRCKQHYTDSYHIVQVSSRIYTSYSDGVNFHSF